MRKTPEWIGTSDDARIPDRVRLRVFLRYNGACQCGCGHKIVTGEPWQCDHRIALVNGGENRENNLVPLLLAHHQSKTKNDLVTKSKTYRKRKAHLGLKQSRNPLPGSRASKWKKKISGEVVRRERPRHRY